MKSLDRDHLAFRRNEFRSHFPSGIDVFCPKDVGVTSSARTLETMCSASYNWSSTVSTRTLPSSRKRTGTHRPFGPNNTPHSASSLTLSSKAAAGRWCAAAVALFRTRWGLGKATTTSRDGISTTFWATNAARL